jgi:hypothetical protein
MKKRRRQFWKKKSKKNKNENKWKKNMWGKLKLNSQPAQYKKNSTKIIFKKTCGE